MGFVQAVLLAVQCLAEQPGGERKQCGTSSSLWVGAVWGRGSACTAAHRLLSLSTLIAYLLLVFRA